MEELMTHEETANVLRVSTTTLLRLGEKRQIARIRVGGQWRYRKADVEAYLNRSTMGSKVAA